MIIISRIRKDPEVRQAELMDAALELFSSVGYEKTMVVDIVKKAGVAKGTFFYHFPTKEAVLEAICMRWAQELAACFYLQNPPGTAALNKLQAFIVRMLTPDPIDTIFNKLWDEKNLDLLYRIWRKQIQTIFNSLLHAIISQGNEEKTMHTYCIQETLSFFWSTLECLWEAFYSNESPEVLLTKTKIAETVLERILGIKEGKLSLPIPYS